jgi:hypothetical protein
VRYHGNLLPAYAMLTAADRAVPPAGAPMSPRLVEALTVGVTPATLEPRLAAFVDCASVTTMLTCCAT